MLITISLDVPTMDEVSVEIKQISQSSLCSTNESFFIPDRLFNIFCSDSSVLHKFICIAFDLLVY